MVVIWVLRPQPYSRGHVIAILDLRHRRWSIEVGFLFGSMALVAARQALRLSACKDTLLLIFAPMTMSDYIF